MKTRRGRKKEKQGSERIYIYIERETVKGPNTRDIDHPDYQEGPPRHRETIHDVGIVGSVFFYNFPPNSVSSCVPLPVAGSVVLRSRIKGRRLWLPEEERERSDISMNVCGGG